MAEAFFRVTVAVISALVMSGVSLLVVAAVLVTAWRVVF